MYYLVDCDIARGVGLLIANKDSRKGSQNVKTNNQQYLFIRIFQLLSLPPLDLSWKMKRF